MLNAEAEELIGASRYERSEEREGYRSGHYRGDHYLTVNTGISIAKEIGKGSGVIPLENGRITVSLPADTQINNTAGCVVETEKPSENRTDFEKLTTLDNLTSAVRYIFGKICGDKTYTENQNLSFSSF